MAGSSVIEPGTSVGAAARAARSKGSGVRSCRAALLAGKLSALLRSRLPGTGVWVVRRGGAVGFLPRDAPGYSGREW